MQPDSLLYKAMSGQRGLLPSIVRTATLPLSGMYSAIIRRRNRRFDAGIGVERVAVPVISVGNITTGGTGKTPLVIALTQMLMEMGGQVAVVARGYGAKAGAENDEMLLIRRRVPGAAVVSNPDRVAAAREAVESHGATCVLADDAFQHRRLHRDLDIAVVDATQPFGFGHLLPRGLLREPAAALRRADLIVISRSNLVTAAELKAVTQSLLDLHVRATVILSAQTVTGLFALDDHPAGKSLEVLGPILLLAAIGHPRSFEETVRRFNPQIVGAPQFLSDHHNYHRHDVSWVLQLARIWKANAVIVTEKDAVKLRHLVPSDSPVPFYALRIDLDFPEGGDKILRDRLRTVLESRRQA